MITAYLIYIFIPLIMIALAIISQKKIYIKTISINSKIFNYIALVLFSLIIGMRYGVGIDYFSYLQYFKEFHQDNLNFIEPGYHSIIRILRFLDVHFSWLFILSSFIQIFFIYKAFDKSIFLLPWIIFFYFVSLTFFNSLTLIRQCIAFSIFIYSLQFIQSKKSLYFIVCIAFAVLFHKSALILLPTYFFAFYDPFSKRRIVFIMLIITFILKDFLQQIIWNNIEFLTSFSTYSEYGAQKSFIKEITGIGEKGLGLGVYLLLFLDLIIVQYSDRLKENYNTYGFIIYYNIYLIGALAGYIFWNSFILSRINLYFSGLKFIILAFLFYDIFKINNDSKYITKIIFSLIIIVQLAFFFNSIYRHAGQCSPFIFFFYSEGF